MNGDNKNQNDYREGDVEFFDKDTNRPENAQKWRGGKRDKSVMASFPIFIVALIAFLLLGFLRDGWEWCWMVFLTIPLYYMAVKGSFKGFLYGAYPLLCVIVFLCLGFLGDLWHPGWLVFVTIPIFYSVMNAIIKKKWSGIYTVVCIVAYLAMGFLGDLWHPGWIIFLTIPVAEWAAKAIADARHKNR